MVPSLESPGPAGHLPLTLNHLYKVTWRAEPPPLSEHLPSCAVWIFNSGPGAALRGSLG